MLAAREYRDILFSLQVGLPLRLVLAAFAGGPRQ